MECLKGGEYVRIEILGPGCAKCKGLEKNVKRAVKELGVKAEIIKVEDIQEIMDRGVMMTPALFIDGKAKAVGRLPEVEEIKRMISSKVGRNAKELPL
jgi:small redox-active disulfide protein 2